MISSTSHELSAVVIIPVHRPVPLAWESFAIRHNTKILEKHPIFFVMPEGMDERVYTSLCPAASIKRFSGHYFRSNHGNNLLCLESFFYEAFNLFEYMLKCEADAFVFEDLLQLWCAKKYSYTGSPICVRDAATQKVNSWLPAQNGGLSLRNINHHLDVLHSSKKVNLSPLVENMYLEMEALMRQTTVGEMRSRPLPQLKDFIKSYKTLLPSKNITEILKQYFDGSTISIAEDQFLCRFGPLFDSKFKLAAVDEAMFFGLQEGFDFPHWRYLKGPVFGSHGPWYPKTAQRFIESGESPGDIKEYLLWKLLCRNHLVPDMSDNRISPEILDEYHMMVS